MRINSGRSAMEEPEVLVKELKERGLLPRLQRYCPSNIVGDDGAVISVAPGQSLVVTTDVLVDEVHFSDRTTTAFDVGWRAVTTNLSDLAAMGADPIGITVGLCLPGDVRLGWVEELYRGMNTCLQPYDTAILGGDVCRSATITVAITAFGQVLPDRVIRRSNARIGDAIVVTGGHGASRAGLELLLNPEKGKHLKDSERALLIRAHQRPNPRLDVLKHLWEICKAQHRLAGIDSSDGLADALIQICRCSQVGARIERQAIPLLPALLRFVSSEQALEWALYGGEDFELVLCLPLQSAKALVESLGEGAAIIGEIVAEKENVELVDNCGIYPRRLLNLAEGFQHF